MYPPATISIPSKDGWTVLKTEDSLDLLLPLAAGRHSHQYHPLNTYLIVFSFFRPSHLLTLLSSNSPYKRIEVQRRDMLHYLTALFHTFRGTSMYHSFQITPFFSRRSKPLPFCYRSTNITVFCMRFACRLDAPRYEFWTDSQNSLELSYPELIYCQSSTHPPANAPEAETSFSIHWRVFEWRQFHKPGFRLTFLRSAYLYPFACSFFANHLR